MMRVVLFGTVVLECVLLLLPLCDALTVSFTRRLDTCDPQDQPLTDGTTKFIYAYSNKNPAENGGKPTKHQQSGTRSARIMESKPVPPVLPPDAQLIPLVASNLTVPFPSKDRTTSYYCHIHAINVTSRAHIVQWAPVFNPSHNIKYVHHILVYECPTATPADVGSNDLCDKMPPSLKQCQQNNVVAGWAVGGGAFNYPENIGYPVGTDDTVQYVITQTHYNNPTQDVVVDSSGLNFVVTQNYLRPIEAAMLWTGYLTTPQFSIPANMSDSNWVAPCPSQCTHEIFPQPVKIFATLLHMHTTGRAIKTRHIRNGTELTPILSDPHYDFNFQDFEYLGEERDLLPGDELITECHFDTTSRNTSTTFGESTQQEMCMSFHLLYPRNHTNPSRICHFANYTILNPTQTPTVYCPANPASPVPNIIMPLITTPLPVINCTHMTPITTPPRLSNLSTFNASWYDRQLYLDGDDSQQVSLWWTVDHVEQLIHFAMSVNVDGWIGLGFSPTGGMPYSDVMTSWIDSNNVTGYQYHVEDRMVGAAKVLPMMDTWQDIYNVVFYQDPIIPSPSNTEEPSKLSNAALAVICLGSFIFVGILMYACYRYRAVKLTETEDAKQLIDGGDGTSAKTYSL